MIRLLFPLLLFTAFDLLHGVAANPLYSMSAIRSAYVKAIDESSKATEFHKRMKQINAPGPLKLGYKGASKTLKAKHSWNPIKKMRHLKKGMRLISKAIAQKPEDVELRFLRLSVAYYLPDFLGYNEHLEPDKEQILKNLLNQPEPQKPDNVLTVICKFLCEEDLCDEADQKALKQLAN